MILKHIATWMTVTLGILAVFALMFMLAPEQRKHAGHERRLEELRAERAREEIRLHELRVQQQRFQTEADYVRRVAHEIGMVEPHEVIYRFHDDNIRTRRPYGN